MRLENQSSSSRGARVVAQGSSAIKINEAAGLPVVISLFSGAGGLDLGFKQAGFTVSVAIDTAAGAIRTHKRNFPRTWSEVGDLIQLQPDGVLEIVKKSVAPGGRIAVIGGPPCQGFSRANTASLASDPRNKLPQLYVEIVRSLQKVYTVEFIILENVLGIRDKKHIATFNDLKVSLKGLGLDITEQEFCAVDFGVPQNRRRIILSGLRAGQGYGAIKPRKRKGPITVREAIGDLENPVFFQKGLDPAVFPEHPNHWTMQPKSPRFEDPDAHSGDGRSFKRLKWDEPSPTIAFGHREIHIHPDGRRRLSIYEALLLQGFPSSFVLEGNLSEQVEQVSNAVPPPLAHSVANAVKHALRESRND